MENKNQRFQIGEAASYLGVTPQTLRAWERKGILSPLRTPTNYRVYTKAQLDELIG